MRRFTLDEVNFEVKHEGHQNCSKIEQFWWPSCFTRKLTWLGVNLLMSSVFLTSCIVYIFDILKIKTVSSKTIFLLVIFISLFDMSHLFCSKNHFRSKNHFDAPSVEIHFCHSWTLI